VKLGKSGREILEMLETVYGESAMELRTVKSGSTVVRLAAKKCVRVVQKSTSCSLLFFIFEEWSIRNLFHGVKQLMPHFMWKF
jgi:hypothetical protein